MNPSQGLVEGPIPSSRSGRPFSSTVELWYRKPQMSVQFWQGALIKGKIQICQNFSKQKIDLD